VHGFAILKSLWSIFTAIASRELNIGATVPSNKTVASENSRITLTVKLLS
jgi:hypothetical protein